MVWLTEAMQFLMMLKWRLNTPFVMNAESLLLRNIFTVITRWSSDQRSMKNNAYNRFNIWHKLWCPHPHHSEMIMSNTEWF
jgi:hypothetical protein